MSILGYIFLILLLSVVPYVLGNALCIVTGAKASLPKCYVFGMLASWAFMQLIAVPMIIAKLSFDVLFWVVASVVIVSTICAVILWIKDANIKSQFKIATNNKIELVIFIAGIAFAALFVILTILLTHVDEDDSRFVVNAIDMVKNKKMFLSNPATGEIVNEWVKEVKKDITSPWAVFAAVLSRATGVNATIVMHTFISTALMVMLCMVIWMVADYFFENDMTGKVIFLVSLIILYIFGDYSTRSFERFTLVRIWQGKAVIAGIGIMLVLLICMWIYKETDQKCNYIFLAITNLAFCFLSGMGIIIGAIVIGATGFVYAILKRKIKPALLMWLMILPNVVYYMINAKIA